MKLMSRMNFWCEDRLILNIRIFQSSARAGAAGGGVRPQPAGHVYGRAVPDAGALGHGREQEAGPHQQQGHAEARVPHGRIPQRPGMRESQFSKEILAHPGSEKLWIKLEEEEHLWTKIERKQSEYQERNNKHFIHQKLYFYSLHFSQL